ncbi:MAG: hypothetical protein H7096_07370 [Flavobacterium sp.]|nr:hypothetical protein [Pedobacter sp.]
MKKIDIYILLAVTTYCTMFYSCKKPDIGYISDFLSYIPNKFNVPQGKPMFTDPIVADGSTAPLSVKMTGIRNKTTGAAVPEELLQERDVLSYKGQITPADNTLELLSKKIVKAKFAPVRVNPTGGRLEFSGATSFLPAATYVIDVEASNTKGIRIVLNAAEFILTPKQSFNASFGEVSLQSQSPTEPNPTANYLYDVPGSPNITATRDEKGPNKIIFEFIDGKGNKFNPQAGEIVILGGSDQFGAKHNDFSMFDPYYPVIKTATSLEFQYPDLAPEFPLFRLVDNDFLGYRVIYKIPAAFNKRNRNIKITFSIRFFDPGTWTVKIVMFPLERVV